MRLVAVTLFRVFATMSEPFFGFDDETAVLVMPATLRKADGGELCAGGLNRLLVLLDLNGGDDHLAEGVRKSHSLTPEPQTGECHMRVPTFWSA